jgi:hypothetical protein
MALGVTDMQRTEKAILGIVGKRLTYRRTGDGATSLNSPASSFVVFFLEAKKE